MKKLASALFFGAVAILFGLLMVHSVEILKTDFPEQRAAPRDNCAIAVVLLFFLNAAYGYVRGRHSGYLHLHIDGWTSAILRSTAITIGMIGLVLMLAWSVGAAEMVMSMAMFCFFVAAGIVSVWMGLCCEFGNGQMQQATGQ